MSENELTYTLSNGIKVPRIGMGTWPLRGENLEYLISKAIELGYRMFDTADNYFNEEFVGNVIVKHSKRDELFIVTKLSDEKKMGFPYSSIGKYFYKTSPFMQTHSAKETVNLIFENSIKKLKTDYVDCLIMHWPYPDYFLEIYSAMEDLLKEGKVRSIGVSNCRERHLELLRKNGLTKPHIHQLSLSPLNTKVSLVEYCKRENIRLVCYAPLMCARNKLFCDASISNKIAQKYGIGLSRLLLLWNMKQGFIPIPKSTHVERLKENFETLALDMNMDDVFSLSNLNCDYQYLPESVYCPGM